MLVGETTFLTSYLCWLFEEAIEWFEITSSYKRALGQGPSFYFKLLLHLPSSFTSFSIYCQRWITDPKNSSQSYPEASCLKGSVPHDGRYGSGRFCSKKCSRTVGGKALAQAYAQKREAKTQKTTSSYMQFSVENPDTWNCETIVLHRLNSNKNKKTRQS